MMQHSFRPFRQDGKTQRVLNPSPTPPSARSLPSAGLRGLCFHSGGYL